MAVLCDFELFGAKYATLNLLHHKIRFLVISDDESLPLVQGTLSISAFSVIHSSLRRMRFLSLYVALFVCYVTLCYDYKHLFQTLPVTACN